MPVEGGEGGSDDVVWVASYDECVFCPMITMASPLVRLPVQGSAAGVMVFVGGTMSAPCTEGTATPSNNDSNNNNNAALHASLKVVQLQYNVVVFIQV